MFSEIFWTVLLCLSACFQSGFAQFTPFYAARSTAKVLPCEIATSATTIVVWSKSDDIILVYANGEITVNEDDSKYTVNSDKSMTIFSVDITDEDDYICRDVTQGPSFHLSLIVYGEFILWR